MAKEKTNAVNAPSVDDTINPQVQELQSQVDALKKQVTAAGKKAKESEQNYGAAVRVAVKLQRELSHLAPDTYGSQRDAEKKIGQLIAQELLAQ